MEPKLKKNSFIGEIKEAIGNNTFVKLTLGKRAKKAPDLRNIYIRPVVIKDNLKLSFTYRYTSKDDVRNYTIEEGIQKIDEFLCKKFLSGHLFTIEKDVEIIFSHKLIPALKESRPTFSELPSSEHDREKLRFIRTKDNIYLRELGIVNAEGVVKAGMHDKFRQINKYIEIFGSLLKHAHLGDNISVVDMGSGKGYLTFALYDYLSNTMKRKVKVLGIEQRQVLVDFCNKVAEKAGFGNLVFEQGNIADASLEKTDVLIALHACDTATDDAIYKGIKADASLILCAPCCHKQIRKQITQGKTDNPVIKFGILKERQAEIITDTIRALLLAACGYKTNIIEFISTEHTSKNIMIAGVKGKGKIDHKKISSQIDKLKSQYGIEYHYLERLLEKCENNK
jgi:hypothetical protein